MWRFGSGWMCDVLGIRTQISDRARGVLVVTEWQNDFLNLFLFVCLFSFQYYEMSYGLNIEMHKQVGAVLVPIPHLGGFSTGSGTELAALAGRARMPVRTQSCGGTCVLRLLCVWSRVKLRFVFGF